VVHPADLITIYPPAGRGDYRTTPGILSHQLNAMLPAANLGLRGLYDTTVEFFALRSPTLSSRGSSSDSEQERSLTPVDPVARLTRECASLREKLNKADSRDAACVCRKHIAPGLTFASMRRELDETKRELAKSKMEAARLAERCNKLERTLWETREVVKARDAELHRLRQGTAVSAPAGIQRHDSTESQSESESSFRGIVSYDGAAETGRDLPSSQEEDIAQRRASEGFMTRLDTWSGAQVLQATHDLNSEILQLSATATELCTFQKNHLPSAKLVQAMQDTTSRMGQRVSNVLSTRDHSQDPILVQLILQGCIATCVARAFSSFSMGFPSKHDAILRQIYSHMYLASKQCSPSQR
jgi:hypothetical protein